ncbi:MAG TPA: 3-isopropylmalate dehydratase small subunit [Candidatus Thermoplasmatota archaeon]|nr:3-isopropylmalate dehydratase small subunit [Candidatus Thermoplasmatota archaeon]
MARVWKYGDDVNTDVLFPGRHLANIDPKHQAAHALEDLDPLFAKTVQPGDVVVGGKFFGCGSSREQAVTCLKYAGVPFVVAASFARIYYRNAINNGLPPLVSPAASAKIQAGDDVTADLGRGVIINRTRNETYPFEPFPEFLQRLLAAGGLIPYLRQQVLVKQ